MLSHGWVAPHSSSSVVVAWAVRSTPSWLTPRTCSQSLSKSYCMCLTHKYSFNLYRLEVTYFVF